MEHLLKNCRTSVVCIGAIFCLSLFPVELPAQPEGTARDYFAAAEQEAQSWEPDADLMYLLGLGEDLYVAGELLSWSYLFGSNQADSLYLVTIALGLPVFSGEVIDTFALMEPLPDNWIDSDVAVAVAEDHGGSEFRQNTGSDLIVATAGVGLYLLDLMRPVWLFTYTDTSDFLATTLIYVDAVTGEWIDTQGVGIGDRPEGGRLPKSFSLGQNYPNPFNPSTTLNYTVPEGMERKVSLEIFDARGRRVKTLFNGRRGPGTYKVHWSGRNDRGEGVGTGIYLAKLRSDGEVLVRKMTLAK